MSRRRALIVLALAALAGGGSYAAWYFEWLPDWPGGPRGFGPPAAAPDEHYSNILPGDYIGPQACGKCHEAEYKRWSAHPHRFMNQLPTARSIRGDFDNHVWQVRPGYTVTFSTEAGDYFMTVDRPEGPRTRYRVTRTVGSRFVQFYIGVQTEGPERRGDKVYKTEHKLPFGYWFRMKRWLPVDYFDVGEDVAERVVDDHLVVEGVDAKASYIAYMDSCVHCHNTYPHVYRVFRQSLAGFPDAVIDGDFRPLRDALRPRMRVRASASAFASLPYALDPDRDLVTVGISCESCHLGGREHSAHEKEMTFFPASPHVRVTARLEDKPFTGKRDDPATSQGVCAQCHSARAVATYPNGARVRNSCESLDLAEGSCTSKVRCVDCHEPHTPGVPSGGPTLPRYLEACVKCHPKYASPEKAEAHGRHPAKAGVDCLDCHMPRISQGIDEVSRTHRISMPVERPMISAGAPNACNLCHLDKSVNWTLAELKRGWEQEVRPDEETPAAFLEEPASKVWLNSARSITRITAVDACARSPRWKTYLPDVLGALNDVNSTNRAFALFAAERLAGRRLSVGEIDILAGPERRGKQVERLRAAFPAKR